MGFNTPRSKHLLIWKDLIDRVHHHARISLKTTSSDSDPKKKKRREKRTTSRTYGQAQKRNKSSPTKNCTSSEVTKHNLRVSWSRSREFALHPMEKVAGLINSAKFAMDIPSKLEHLRHLKDELFQADPVLLSEFLRPLLDLLADGFSPVRKFIIEIAGDIGLKHMEFLPEIIPVVIAILKDVTPAVARQGITCGIDIFRCTLVKVAIQGLYSSDLDDSLESSWAWVQKFRDEVYSIAFQAVSDGRRLLALKFIEAVILLYTPDPSGLPEPPSHQALEGKSVDFNISWLRGGHPVAQCWRSIN
ncbi:hypothetical protein F0562_015280 [Nyssa sinensis]|uniref:Symplekin/Pta1 N-terminal domain-containing protein n=1 Tax=Nyssa sinensis TaxID=561372 RepID=A0A5J4ZJR4_9ASTE|nr:hypothetical protein F0562_015280 [Nyssa sinensis]